ARWVARPVAQGVVLGLGLALMLQGAKLMSGHWLVGLVALAVVVPLVRSRRLPGIFVLLLMGLGWTAWQHPEMFMRLDIRWYRRWPPFSWPAIGWHELAIGTLFLALPQVPLTLGNAVIGVSQENNRLFPERPVSERRAAFSTGLMNVFGSAGGGGPVWHGARGEAGP